MDIKLDFPEELKSLTPKVKAGTASAAEKERFKELVNYVTAQFPKPPDPRDVYVTDKNGILVLDKQGRPIPK